MFYHNGLLWRVCLSNNCYFSPADQRSTSFPFLLFCATAHSLHVTLFPLISLSSFLSSLCEYCPKRAKPFPISLTIKLIIKPVIAYVYMYILCVHVIYMYYVQFVNQLTFIYPLLLLYMYVHVHVYEEVLTKACDH